MFAPAQIFVKLRTGNYTAHVCCSDSEMAAENQKSVARNDFGLLRNDSIQYVYKFKFSLPIKHEVAV